MEKKFIHKFSLIVIGAIFLAHNLWADDILKDKTVYVWNFIAKDDGSRDLAESVTEEFEQALIRSRSAIVLQRRYYKRLFDQRQQEIRIKRLEGLDKNSIEKIKSKDVQLVIFGEVYDDNASGQIKISALVQDFDSHILASESVYAPRSIKLDPQSRKEYIINLVGTLTSSGETREPSEKKLGTELPITKTIADLRVTLTEIILNGTNLEINFEVINRSQTRTLSIEGAHNIVLYDDTGRELHPTSINIGELQNQKTLVPGIPVNMKFSFQGVFDDVIWIPELKMYMSINGWHEWIFNDLRIPR